TDPAPTSTDTLPLHDALPIYAQPRPPAPDAHGWNAHWPAPVITAQDCWRNSCCTPSDVRLATFEVSCDWNRNLCETMVIWNSWRSEEHTSELQSRENLVCRLL